MNTKEILTIIALVILGVCLIYTLTIMTMKTGDKYSNHVFICGTVVVLAIILLVVCQLLGDKVNFTNTVIITISGKTDGFGAQYIAKMSGIAYARHAGYKYYHIPFRKMEHIPEGDVNKMEEFGGLRSDDVCKNLCVKNQKHQHYITEVHNSTNPEKYYTNSVREELRKMYDSTSKPRRDPRCDVAFHVRRGDVTIAENNDRYTTNSEIGDQLDKLIKMFPTKTICLFSQGEEKDFASVVQSRPYVLLKLNEPLIDTFHNMVTANVLVIAKSSLSYSAGILNRGRVFYRDIHFHKPLASWEKL